MGWAKWKTWEKILIHLETNAFQRSDPMATFIFSSDGHVGLGGLDIYVAKQNNNQQWEIEHPGFPLNSKATTSALRLKAHITVVFFLQTVATHADGTIYTPLNIPK